PSTSDSAAIPGNTASANTGSDPSARVDTATISASTHQNTSEIVSTGSPCTRAPSGSKPTKVNPRCPTPISTTDNTAALATNQRSSGRTSTAVPNRIAATSCDSAAIRSPTSKAPADDARNANPNRPSRG